MNNGEQLMKEIKICDLHEMRRSTECSESVSECQRQRSVTIVL